MIIVLLSAEDFGDFPTWVLAIEGLATLILAVVTYFQGNKIKELEDIAVEQKEHTRIFSNMLRHMQFEYAQKTSPKFEYVGTQSKAPGDFLLKLHNYPAIIRGIKIVPPLPGIQFRVKLGAVINKDDIFNFPVTIDKDVKDGNYEFFIDFTNDDREVFTQRGMLTLLNNKPEINLFSIRPMDMFK